MRHPAMACGHLSGEWWILGLFEPNMEVYGRQTGAVRGTAKTLKSDGIATIRDSQFCKIPPIIPPNGLARAIWSGWNACGTGPVQPPRSASRCGVALKLTGTVGKREHAG